MFARTAPMLTFKAAQTVVTRSTQPVVLPALDTLKFGKSFTNHIFECAWSEGKQWGTPELKPMHNLSLHPATSVFHYAIECFEGMKAYVDANNEARLFRPDMNAKRMRTSLARLALPDIDEAEFVEAVKQLVRLEKDWIPRKKGFSLYLRPTCISTDPFLGVTAASQALFFIIASPVGPYYANGFKPVSLLVEDHLCRAWRGGTGGYKIGSNYAPTVQPQKAVVHRGFDQILWLADKYVTEVGAMNFFVLWKTKDGAVQLVTAPLEMETILPGVTRDSILTLCRQWNEFEVVERPFTIDEVTDACKEGRLLEAFGAGTAAIVSQVRSLQYLGVDYAVPTDEKKSLALRLMNTILAIQYGETPHEWSVKC